jgi:ATP:corrinoid adenosyltransferase
MSEENKTSEEKLAAEAAGKNQVALELMKFIAVNTGYGKGTAAAGFGGKSTVKSPEEHADALIELFKRCRDVVNS